MNRTIPILFSVALAAGCATDRFENEDDRMFGERTPAEFIDGAGDAVGSAVLTQTPNGVLVDVELRGLDPGWHGFHVHERADCAPPDFKSAGGHYGPDGGEHGLLVRNGPHAGDMPNIFVNADGAARFQVIATNLSLRSGDNELFDSDGSAIMIHSDPDDYRSQPSGNAGTRIACAEID